MAYVTIAQMYDYYDKNTLAMLSNDGGTKSVRTSIIQRAIDRGAAILDSKIGAYVSLSDSINRVVDMNAELTYAFLLQRRTKGLAQGKAIQQNIELDLIKIQDGTDSLDGSSSPTASNTLDSSEPSDLMSRSTYFDTMTDPLEDMFEDN